MTLHRQFKALVFPFASVLMIYTLRPMAKRRPAALSIRPEEYTAAKARADALGMNFSAYVNSLIRRDMEIRGPIIIQERAAEPPCSPPPERKTVTYTKKPRQARPRALQDLKPPRVCAVSQNCPEACPILSTFDHRAPSPRA